VGEALEEDDQPPRADEVPPLLAAALSSAPPVGAEAASEPAREAGAALFASALAVVAAPVGERRALVDRPRHAEEAGPVAKMAPPSAPAV
jgi:hypothetical protein